jgi:uncharacterized protein (DUF2235 family)
MKNLILCLDGTWSNADSPAPHTNIAIIAEIIDPSPAGGAEQRVYYDAGVGTGGVLDRILGGAFGRGLSANTLAAYRFLSQFYRPGDNIYVFGFSRGAFTARSLCGFIGACKGLLLPNSLHKLEAAWRYYRTNPAARNKFEHYQDIEQSVHDAYVNCLGIWDTVGALGIPSTWFQHFNNKRYAFHDTEISFLVKHAFHAIAIDEKRNPFAPSLWARPKKPIYDQIVEQVWFPGVHSNVGGSYPDTDLADLTLRWMLGRVNAHTKLAFSAATLDYLLPDRPNRPDPAKKPDKRQLERLKAKWMGNIYESRSGAFLRDKLIPTMRIVDDQRPPARTFRNRLFPVEASAPFEHAVHWSARDRYLSWREEGLDCYEPANMSWAWPEIRRGNVKIVEFADEVLPGKPWAGSIEDLSPVVPKRQRQRKRRPDPRDPDEKPVPLQ